MILGDTLEGRPKRERWISSGAGYRGGADRLPAPLLPRKAIKMDLIRDVASGVVADVTARKAAPIPWDVVSEHITRTIFGDELEPDTFAERVKEIRRAVQIQLEIQTLIDSAVDP